MKNKLSVFCALVIAATLLAGCKGGDKVKIADNPTAAQVEEYIRAVNDKGYISISVDEMIVDQSNPGCMDVKGQIKTSRRVEQEDLFKVANCTHPAGLGGFYLDRASDDDCIWNYTLKGLIKGNESGNAVIKVRASEIGFSEDAAATFEVPGKSEFKVLRVRDVMGNERYVEILFSQPLDRNADYSGLASIKGVTSERIVTDKNSLRIYYDNIEADEYQVEISDKIAAYNSARLGVTTTEIVARMQDFPFVSLDFKGSILPDQKRLELPFTAANLAAVDLKVIEIYPENILMFLQENNLNGSFDLRGNGRLVYKQTIPLDGENLHRANKYSIDLSEMFKRNSGAIYRVVLSYRYEYSLYNKDVATAMDGIRNYIAGFGYKGVTKEDNEEWDETSRYYYQNYIDWENYKWSKIEDPEHPSYYMESDRMPSVNLLATNIGIIAKSLDNNKIWVAVNDILSSGSISGAEVTAYNYQMQPIAKGKTDGDGFALLETSNKPFVVTAKKGKSISYLRVASGTENSLSRFDVGGIVYKSGIKGFAYGERGVWSPGDTLHLGFFVMDNANSIPDGHPVVIELFNPQGQLQMRKASEKMEHGLAVFNIPTRKDDPTGVWNAYFKIGSTSFHKALRIEDVKANRLSIKLDVPKVLQASETVRTSVASNWLTGPAAKGLKVKVDMTLRNTGSGFDKYKGYVFNNPATDFVSSESELYSGVLNEAGEATMFWNLPQTNTAPGMLSATVVTRVMEQGGDESVVTDKVLYSPYSAYVGIKVPEGKNGYIDTDKEHAIDFVVIDKDQNPVAGHKIEYFVYKLDWRWWWESASESLDSYVNGSYSKPFTKGASTSSNGKQSITVKVPAKEWGRYLIFVKDKTSGHAAGAIAYFDWPSESGRNSRKDPTAATMITFNSDKSAYKAGEKATISIPASDGAMALVSLENSRGILGSKWVKGSSNGEIKYQFTITEDMAPNFYVHVSMLNPYEKTKDGSPVRLYGVQPIEVSNESSHITPVITMADAVAPGEEFTVKVKETSGKPMAYTLAVVDEGLLSLTSFKTPNPWNEMYRREALSVKTWDLYDDVIGAFGAKMSPVYSIGGSDEMMQTGQRDNRFNPVVRFVGPFYLPKGEASHKIKLPMYVGLVRVMVVAGADEAYGNAEKAVAVRAPLMLMSSLPETVGTDETISLPVNVFAMEDKKMDVTVEVAVTGAASLSGASSKSLTFTKADSQIADFNLSTLGAEGEATVKISARGGGFTAEETSVINVRDARPIVTDIKALTVKGGEEKTIKFAPFTLKGDETAVLQISSFPSIDYNGTLSYFVNYPYDCTEQLAAKGLALVSIRDMLSEEKKAECDAAIKETIAKLVSRQGSDGGFCYWPGGYTNDWISSMAGEFLVRAKNVGFEVQKDMLDNWSKFQKRRAGVFSEKTNVYLEDLEQAYRLYTLALNSQTESGAMNRLKESQYTSPQAKWRLAAAYAIAGKKNIAKEIIADLQTEVAEYAETRLFGSASRDRAMYLQTLALSDELTKAMPLAEQVAAFVAENGYDTQNLAFSAVALYELAQKMKPGDVTATVTSGSNKYECKSGTSWMEIVAPDAGEIAIKNNAASGIIYASYMTKARARDKAFNTAANNGVSINLEFVDKSGKTVNYTSLSQGTDFKAVITVKNLSPVTVQNNMALVFTAPSGWGIFNDRLHSDSTLEGVEYQDIREDKELLYFSLGAGQAKTFTINLTAKYQGEFVLPAVMCENMYDNKVNAHTYTTKVAVTK